MGTLGGVGIWVEWVRLGGVWEVAWSGEVWWSGEVVLSGEVGCSGEVWWGGRYSGVRRLGGVGGLVD